MGLEERKYRTVEEMKKDLKDFSKAHKMRESWHEPDEQGIYAKVIGNHLDNAFGEDETGNEFVVVLYEKTAHDYKEVGRVNLATLLAVACL